MERIARALDITDATIPEVTETQRSGDLAEDTRDCLTGRQLNPAIVEHSERRIQCTAAVDNDCGSVGQWRLR